MSVILCKDGRLCFVNVSVPFPSNIYLNTIPDTESENKIEFCDENGDNRIVLEESETVNSSLEELKDTTAIMRKVDIQPFKVNGLDGYSARYEADGYRYKEIVLNSGQGYVFTMYLEAETKQTVCRDNSNFILELLLQNVRKI